MDIAVEKIEKRLLKAIGEAISDFKLIEDGDRILVAVSGGKDSFALLHLLLLLQGRAPVKFDLEAVNLDPGYPGYRPDLVQTYCASRGVRIHMLTAPIHQMVEEKLAPGEPACPLCSRIRRGAFYSLAERENFSKVALGHHFDDVAETLLMNLFYAGTLRGMSPLLKRAPGASVIRPLVYALEEDLAAYAEAQKFPVIPCASSHCADADRRRQVVKRMLAGLEAEHPDIKNQMRRALRNVDLATLLLPQRENDLTFQGRGMRSEEPEFTASK